MVGCSVLTPLSRLTVRTKKMTSRLPYITRQKPIYDNCFVYAPSGHLMFRCSKKRINWYLSRNLAVLYSPEFPSNTSAESTTSPSGTTTLKPAKATEERFTDVSTSLSVKLTFEPNGQGRCRPGDEFYLEDQQNQCVSCGSAKCLVVLHVVPYQYKRFFPENLKEHSSHDNLALCTDCHARYAPFVQEAKKTLATKCGVPLEGKGYIRHPERFKAAKAASALLTFREKLPEKRTEELFDIVRGYLQLEGELTEGGDLENKRTEIISTEVQVTDDLLRSLSQLPVMERAPDFIEHGRAVVEDIEQERGRDGLEEFVRLWRSHFLEHVQPKRLNVTWRVEDPAFNE